MKSITDNYSNGKMKWIWFASLLFVLFSFVRIHPLKKESTNNVSTGDSCSCYSTSSFQQYKVRLNNTVPGDILQATQGQINCFAWQEFIALNWPADTSHSFGQPWDTSPVDWETFMPRDVLFADNGTAPPAWGTLVSDKYVALFKSQKLLLNKQHTKLLTFKSKFDESDTLNESGEAAPFGSPSWLGAQNGTNVWYEVLLNRDYYDYVVKAKYYNAAVQHDSVKAGTPINFPEGQLDNNGNTTITGAIEIKASWMEVDNPKLAKWNQYKLSAATVLDGASGKLRNTTVALVGLHILHKTQGQPTWVWATFEQVNNVPNNCSSTDSGYNFFSPVAKSQTFKVKNSTGTSDTTVTVTSITNTAPPYYLRQGKPVPIQVCRVNAIDQTDAAPVNAKMQAFIKSAYPKSVFQYYQLVDVIWSINRQPLPPYPKDAPDTLNQAYMQSGTKIVANTTMETYVQNQLTCTGCHTFSTIAPYPKDSANNNRFGDFSFAIGTASFPQGPKVQMRFTLKK